MDDWNALERFVRGLCAVEIGERVQPIIDKLVEDLRGLKKGGYDNPDLVNRLCEIEASLDGLKRKLETPIGKAVVRLPDKKSKVKDKEQPYLEPDDEVEGDEDG